MITYGNGKVLFDGAAKGFEMRYKGSIRITSSPDNLLLSANKNKIIGVMLDGTDMPQELFNYVGELRVLSCKSVQGESMERERITLQGVDYWELDREKWEDDGSLWGTRDGTYLIGSKQRFNKKRIVVNNNIQSNGKFQYGDGTPLSDNALIHIMNDGTPMSEGVHSKDSEYIYPYIKKPTVLSKTQYNMPDSIAPYTNTYSLNFDGTNDYMDVNDAALARFVEGDEFSISLWVRSEILSDNSNRCMFSISDDGTTANRFRLEHDTQLDRLIYTLEKSGASDTLIITSQDLDDRNWYHIVLVTASSTSRELFVNGSKVGTDTSTYTQPTSVFDRITIGAKRQTTTLSNHWKGNIDEVAVWGAALDADAITAVYNSGEPTDLTSDSGDYDNSANLQGYWRMGDGDTYPTITDNSSNSNNGTMTNMVSGDIEEETP